MIDYERFDYEIDEAPAPVRCCRCHDVHTPSCLADTQDDHYEELREEDWDNELVKDRWLCRDCLDEMMAMPEEQFDAEIDRLWPDEAEAATA